MRDRRPDRDMFSYLSPEQRVRPTTRYGDQDMTAQLRELSPRFQRMYSDIGRPSIPPEQLLRALLLQALYTVRSERLLMEEIDYSILFRWFVGLSLDEPIWSPSVFSKNRDRLLSGDIASAFFDAVLRQAREAALLSDEHFTVDGTLLEAWAGLKSFQRTDAGPPPPPDDPGNATVNFHGETRTNDTHVATTDPDAQLYRKGSGKEAKLTYMGTYCSINGMAWSPTSVQRRPRAPPSARPRCSCWRPSRGPRRSAPTRATTSRRLSPACATWGSRRTWRRRSAAVRWRTT